MEKEQVNNLARSYKTTPKFVMTAVERGVADEDMDDLLFARSRAFVTVEDFTFKPTAKMMAGIYTLCEGDFDIMISLLEEAQPDLQKQAETSFAGEENRDSLTYQNGRSFKEWTELLLSNKIAVAFDEKIERMAAVLAVDIDSSSIDEVRKMIYKQLGLSLGVDRTPIELKRLQRQLMTGAFEDVHRDSGGFMPDFDLTPAYELITEFPDEALYAQERLGLSGIQYRIYAAVLLDPECHLRPNGKDSYGFDVNCNNTFVESALKLKRVLMAHLGILTKSLEYENRTKHSLKEAGLLEDPEIADEAQLIALTKAEYLAYHGSLNTFLVDRIGHIGAEAAGGEVLKSFDAIRATGRQLQSFATSELLKHIEMEMLELIVAQFAHANSPAHAYQAICYMLHLDFSDPFFSREQRAEIDTSLQQIWEAATIREQRMQRTYQEYARILAGQRPEEESGY